LVRLLLIGLAYFTSPVLQMMIVEQSVERELANESEALGENPT
jgi:hypothetical protein